MKQLFALAAVLLATLIVQHKVSRPRAIVVAGDVNSISPDLGVGGDDDIDDGTDCDDDDEFMIALA